MISRPNMPMTLCIKRWGDRAGRAEGGSGVREVMRAEAGGVSE